MPDLLDEQWLPFEKAAAKVGRHKTSLREPVARGEIQARDENGKATQKVVTGKTSVMFSDVVRWSNSAPRRNRQAKAVQYSKVTTPPTEAVLVFEKDGSKLTMTLPTSEAETFLKSFFNQGV